MTDITLENRGIDLPLASGAIKPFGIKELTQRRVEMLGKSTPGIISVKYKSQLMARIYSKHKGRNLLNGGGSTLLEILEMNDGFFDLDEFVEWGYKQFKLLDHNEFIATPKYRAVIGYKDRLAKNMRVDVTFPGEPYGNIPHTLQGLREFGVKVNRIGGRESGSSLY